MPLPIDRLAGRRLQTHKNEAVGDGNNPPSQGQFINAKYPHETVTIVDMAITNSTGTATIQTWVYDGKLDKWCPDEKFDLPRTGFPDNYTACAQVQTAGATSGVTISSVAGGAQVSVTMLLASNIAGGQIV